MINNYKISNQQLTKELDEYKTKTFQQDIECQKKINENNEYKKQIEILKEREIELENEIKSIFQENKFRMERSICNINKSI